MLSLLRSRRLLALGIDAPVDHVSVALFLKIGTGHEGYANFDHVTLSALPNVVGHS
jgi:hypothetical protein